MRTLVVVNSLKLGGMERAAVDLADAFASEGHESHLLYFKREAVLLPESPAVHLHHLNLRRRLHLTIAGLLVDMIARLINTRFRRSRYIWTGWLTGWLAAGYIRSLERRYGRFDRLVFRGIDTFKHVWSFRDSRAVYVLESILHDEGPRWQQRLRAKLLFDARHLVAVSQGVMDSYRAAMPRFDFKPRSLQLITNPCSIERIRRLLPEPDPDIPDTPYLLNVGRLVPAKGHGLLLEAYACLNIPEPLVIVGDGPERASLEQLAQELGIAGRVLFAGARSNPYPWMHKARLFVLSSKYEGLGLVLLESLVCGTPVVSVDCPGGVRDILQGPLEANLAPCSAVGLAHSIEEALARPPQVIDDTWMDGFRPARIVSRFLQDPA